MLAKPSHIKELAMITSVYMHKDSPRVYIAYTGEKPNPEEVHEFLQIKFAAERLCFMKDVELVGVANLAEAWGEED